MPRLSDLIYTIIYSIVIIFVLGCVMLLADDARAAGPFSLREVSVDYKTFFAGGQDPLITQNGLENRTLGNEINLHVNSDLLEYLYWDNVVHGVSDRPTYDHDAHSQFRVVGWNFRLGVRVFSWFETGYWHFSKHLLDTTYSGGHWPVQDAFEVKIRLFQRERSSDSLF